VLPRMAPSIVDAGEGEDIGDSLRAGLEPRPSRYTPK
jgi:hypothetical protein